MRNGKMKAKLTAMILSAALLAGCTAAETSPENKARIISSYTNVSDSGMLFSDSVGRLNFFDFESMNSAVLCTRPNCTHSDPDACSAYGMTNHPILYGDDLFFFGTEIVEVQKDGKPEFSNVTTVYKADTDGTNRIAVQVIDGLYMPDIRMVLVGDTAYFSMVKREFDEYGSYTGYEEAWLCSYNISTNEFRKIEKTYEGYHSGTWIYGYWNNKVYFSISYADEFIPYPFGGGGDDLSDYFEQISAVTQNEYKVYDTESGTLTDSDLPEPLCIDGGYYIYDKGGAANVIKENGEEMLLEDFQIPEVGNIYIYGDILFNYRNNVCADLSKGGEVKALNRDPDQYIKAYYNGSYIVSRDTVSGDGTVTDTQYEKVAIDQFIAG